jgi:hypothetical protein
VSARRAAPKPLQGPMEAKIASRAEVHVMSRGGRSLVLWCEAEREGQGAGSRTEEGAVATAEKRSATTLVLFARVSSVSSPTPTTPDTYHLSCPLPERHHHACQRQPSRATSNPNHDRHPPSRNPRAQSKPSEDRPTSRALHSLYNTAIVEQDTSQLKRLSQPRRIKEAANTTALSAFDPLQKDTAIA